jgi:hypothetical protein
MEGRYFYGVIMRFIYSILLISLFLSPTRRSIAQPVASYDQLIMESATKLAENTKASEFLSALKKKRSGEFTLLDPVSRVTIPLKLEFNSGGEKLQINDKTISEHFGKVYALLLKADGKAHPLMLDPRLNSESGGVFLVYRKGVGVGAANEYFTVPHAVQVSEGILGLGVVTGRDGAMFLCRVAKHKTDSGGILLIWDHNQWCIYFPGQGES